MGWDNELYCVYQLSILFLYYCSMVSKTRCNCIKFDQLVVV